MPFQIAVSVQAAVMIVNPVHHAKEEVHNQVVFIQVIASIVQIQDIVV